MLPGLRKKLKNVSSKNQSLQDILRTLNDSTEILSINPQLRGIHNTSIVVKTDLGKHLDPSIRYTTRIHFYNRVPLENILIGLDYAGNNISDIIQKLNLQGCDFTEDDLELVNGQLKAKDISLGYIGSIGSEVPPPPQNLRLLDHQGFGNVSSVDFNFTQTIYDNPNNGDEVEVSIDKFEIILKVNNQTITRIHTEGDGWTPPYNSNQGGSTYLVLAELMDEHDVYDRVSLLVSSQNSPFCMIQNLTDENLDFQYTILRHYQLNGKTYVETVVDFGPIYLLPFGERVAPEADGYPVTCALVDDQLGIINDITDLSEFYGEGKILQGRFQGADWVTIDLENAWTDRGVLPAAIDVVGRGCGMSAAYYIEGFGDLNDVARNYSGDTLYIELRYKHVAVAEWAPCYQLILGTRENEIRPVM